MSQTEDAENLDKNESKTELVKKEDEHLIGGMVYEEVIIDPPEFSDPAILAVRDGPKYRYSKDELLGLKEVPLSKKKPDFINAECVPPSIWDPERWGDAKKSATPTDAPTGGVGGGGKGDVSLQPDGRRGRPGDPRERLRKENDGIVLSPQRRSFNTGCFVPVREQPNHNGRPRAHSPIGGAGGAKGDNAHIGPREVPSNSGGVGSRRIGSGRILRDSWDFNDKNDGGDNDYYRNQDDRRPFRRDFDISRDKDKQQRNSMGRYGNRRISGGEKDEEPEWFSGGPMSQNDTIELRGFDESDRGGMGGGNKKKLNSSQAKRVREWAKKKGGASEDKPEEDQQQQQHAENGQKPQNQQADTKGGESETKQDGGGAVNGPRNDNVEKNQDQDQQNDNDKENRQGHNPPSTTGGMEIINENSFIFDDIFKCDTFPGLLSNGVEGTADNNTKSKFSRWFKRESPDKTESRRSSMQEEHLLKNLLNDINEPNASAAAGGNVAVNIPQLGSSESYFAPISPAAVNAVAGEPGNPKPASGQVNIADMFQRGKQAFGGPKAAQQQSDMLNNIKTQFPGKVLSLNELESNIRKGLDISAGQNQNKHMIKKDDDMAAFKRLLAQVSGGQVVPANGSNHQKMPAMSLMESLTHLIPQMLSHSQQQDEAQARLNSQKPQHLMGGPASPKTPAMNPLHSEFLLKMQQAQQEQQAHLQRHQQQQQQQQQANMLNKLMGLHAAAPHLRSSPLQELAQQQSKELLSRPEAQAILQGMKRGDITPQHIYQQLANPALQPRHREMLSAILRIQRLGPSPRVLSPAPPAHHMFPQQQQQQQLRVSPLPNAMHQRIPSPRELQVHTQTILQRALIKKRLEEQQVNFRKKQEMQQMPNHGSSNKNVSSPTPLAFTPTSVLRKMTADKEDGNKEGKNVEANKFQQGRAVIGARMQQQQPQQQQNNQWNSQYHSKQPGRPIVKANVGYQSTGAEQFFNAQQQQFMFNQQQSRQQQQAIAGQQQVGGQFGQHQKSSQSNTGVSSLGYIGQYSNQSNQQPQQFPQLTQQQLRAQHQQSLPVSTSSAQPAQQQQTQPQQNSQSFSQQQQQNTAWQQFLSAAAAQQSGRSNNARKEDDSSSAAGNVASSGGNTTANQLSRWFSSDLLERARVGELPSTAGLAEHAVSLEEIERQSAPAVHN
ncbi:eukaryotic translation initiation factor 4E transporter-like isoform X3 [Coccinella septempunctata]|uniref:eukaryotic translation initiation factor 4E transporter-like isoform X3 n=1 Tax=Coccinella septempunctata TaxID=41139 RepID=UPI001D0905E9|nr:eukaryotic translation initiation factor 4E transporter-like isoform X3 [Coccinella septempunctata]